MLKFSNFIFDRNIKYNIFKCNIYQCRIFRNMFVSFLSRFDCTDMNIYRSALNACVVSGLRNVKDYIHRERSKNKDEKKTRN